MTECTKRCERCGWEMFIRGPALCEACWEALKPIPTVAERVVGETAVAARIALRTGIADAWGLF